MGLETSHQVSSHNFPIDFAQHQSNPLIMHNDFLSSNNSFELNSQSFAILSKQQIVQNNYQQQFDPLFTNFRSQSKLVYGGFKILCSKITNQKIHEYRMVFRNQQQLKVYLVSYYWRKSFMNNQCDFPLVRTVNFKILQDSKSLLRGGISGFLTKSCSSRRQILCRVYVQDIPLRLCHIKDIPFPENLYVLKQVLRGFQIIYQNIGYIRPFEDLICIGRKGHVKVWINSDLSKNFPNMQNMESNFTQVNSQSKLINQIIQLINSNTDSQGEPCPLVMYLKQRHVNMQHITFQKMFQMLSHYCTQFSIQIPQVFSSIVQVLNQQEQQYDTYRTQMQNQQQQQQNSVMRNNVNSGDIMSSRNNSGLFLDIVNGPNNIKQRSAKQQQMRGSDNVKGKSQRGLIRDNNYNSCVNAPNNSNRSGKKRSTKQKQKTQSLRQNYNQSRSASSSLINNNGQVRSNILLTESMPVERNLNPQSSLDNVVGVGGSAIEGNSNKYMNKIGEQIVIMSNSNNISSKHHLSSQASNNLNSDSNNLHHQQQTNRQPTISNRYHQQHPHQHQQQHKILSTNQLPYNSNDYLENSEYYRNKKTYSNLFERRKIPTLMMMQQQLLSQSSLQQESENTNNYIAANKQEYEQMLRIDRYLQQQMLEQEYQKDKMRSIQSSSCEYPYYYGHGSNNDYYYGSNNNNIDKLHNISKQIQQQQNHMILMHEQSLSNELQVSQQHLKKRISSELSAANNITPLKNKLVPSEKSSQSLSALPDLKQMSNPMVMLKDSENINENRKKKDVVMNDLSIEKKVMIQENISQPIAYHNNPHQQQQSPASESQPASLMHSAPSQINIQTSNQTIPSNPAINSYNPYNIYNTNISNDSSSRQVTSQHTQSQYIVSNTSIGHSVTMQGVNQNAVTTVHHMANHFVHQNNSIGHSQHVFNNQPFVLHSFKSAEFKSYDVTFTNNNKLSSFNSPIIPKVTFTIHSPEVYSTSSHHTTSLQQSFLEPNTLQYSQQYEEPQNVIHPEQYLTVSNAHYEQAQQPNFKRLARRANTVKSHYMNSQGNQISSRKHCELGQNESMQSKPSIVEYSLLGNPEMFRTKKPQQQNVPIHQNSPENTLQRQTTIDLLTSQSNKMVLLHELSQESSEKKEGESIQILQQKKLQSEGGQNVNEQQKQQRQFSELHSSEHYYSHNQSEPQLHLYNQNGEIVPILEDVQAQTINNSRSLLMINNCDQSLNLKTVFGHKNSSNDSNTSQILKSINQNHLSDYENDILFQSYEYQPQQQNENFYHKKLQQLANQCTKKQQQQLAYSYQYNNRPIDSQKRQKESRTLCIFNENSSSSNQHLQNPIHRKSPQKKSNFNSNFNPDSQTDKNSQNNKVNFDLNVNFYTDENQFSKIEHRNSHEINLNVIQINRPSFQSIQSEEIHFKQGFSNQQASHNDGQNQSKKSQKKPYYLKLIPTKSISGSHVGEQEEQNKNNYKFVESIDQNRPSSAYQQAMNDDNHVFSKLQMNTQKNKILMNGMRFLGVNSPIQQKDIASQHSPTESQNISPRGLSIKPITGMAMFLNNEKSLASQLVDPESQIQSQVDYAYNSYDKWKDKFKMVGPSRFQKEENKFENNQSSDQKYLFFKKFNNLPLNQHIQRHSDHKKLVKSSIQGMNFLTNNKFYYLNNTQKKRSSNRQKNIQDWSHDFCTPFQKNYSLSQFMHNEDEIDEEILNDLKDL